MGHYNNSDKQQHKEAMEEIRTWLTVKVEEMNHDELLLIRKVVQNLDDYQSFENIIKLIAKN